MERQAFRLNLFDIHRRACSDQQIAQHRAFAQHEREAAVTVRFDGGYGRVPGQLLGIGRTTHAQAKS